MIGHGVPGLNIRQDYDFDASASVVFAALTAGIDTWWPADARLTGPGGRLSLPAALGAFLIEHGPGDGGAIWGQVDVLAVPVRLYLHGWFGVPGVVMGRVHFDLEDTAAGCHLTMTHQAIGPVSEDVAVRHRSAWREILGVALRQHLTGVAV